MKWEWIKDGDENRMRIDMEIEVRLETRILNEKCPSRAHLFKYLIPSFWCYLGRLQNL